jgi:hypothetical protein
MAGEECFDMNNTGYAPADEERNDDWKPHTPEENSTVLHSPQQKETTMSDTITTTSPQFRTVCQIGFWLRVDAMWTTAGAFGLISNNVNFHLVDGFKNTVQVGSRNFTTDDTGRVVSDEDGESFPDLESAIRHHAEALLKLEWQWTDWQDRPPVHPSAVNGAPTEVAFSQRDIAHAVKLVTTGMLD